jgi:hypothetical protein
MAFLQGDPLPDVTVTTTKQDVAPQYYTDYLSGLAGAGETAIGKTAAEGIAAYDPLQTAGYGAVQGAATSYLPGLTAAQQSAAGLTGGLDTGRISELMDPYRANVVQEMGRLAQQNVQRNVLPSLAAGFVGSGGLGSSRYAGALGQSLADIQSGLTGQQYGALSKGYSDALQAALREQETGIQATKLQGDLAARAQELGLTGAGAMTKAGAERQAYEQAKLDYPMSQATKAAALLRGFQMPMTQTETRTGPLAGAYGTSGLQDLISLTGLIGSGAAGRAGSNVSDWLSAAKNLFPGSSNWTDAEIKLALQDYNPMNLGEDYTGP